MRLVIRYTVSDGCTLSCTETIPIEYESTEAFYIDFEQKLLEYKTKRLKFLEERKKYWSFKTELPNVVDFVAYPEFDLGGHTFLASRFVSDDGEIDMPEILTVDEWFAWN